MKTKFFLSLLLVIALLFTGCENNDDTDGPTLSIENTYARTGPQRSATTNGEGCTIYYPRELESGSYPIIIWGNGTGTPTIAYTPLLTHLASWGFVVVACNNVTNYSGDIQIKAIDYIIEQNETSDSIFYGKLDISRIGITGHSMGGGAAINAATDARVSCSAPLSPGPYPSTFISVTQLNGPILMFTGANDIFPETTYSLYQRAIEGGVNGHPVPAMYAEHSTMNHVSFAWNGGNVRGYLTAWFMYQLQDDPVAANAFINDCEICNNDNWKIEKSNF